MKTRIFFHTMSSNSLGKESESNYVNKNQLFYITNYFTQDTNEYFQLAHMESLLMILKILKIQIK